MAIGIKDAFDGAVKATAQRKNLITFFVLTHLAFLALGQWMALAGYPVVLELRAKQLELIQDLPYLKPLTGLLADSLALKILYTFAFNLVFGAFLSTTASGLIFFLPYLVAVWRGFIIGVLISDFSLTPTMIAMFYGTFVLEFGAYCLSSAVGTDIGLSLAIPERKGADSRRKAFNVAVREGMHLYLFVALILFFAAIWEISWIEYAGGLATTGGLIK